MSLYKESHKRITFDVPESQKFLINSIIPPSTLSHIMRNILKAIYRFYHLEGASKALNALLGGKFRIIIEEKPAEKQNETRGI